MKNLKHSFSLPRSLSLPLLAAFSALFGASVIFSGCDDKAAQEAQKMAMPVAMQTLQAKTIAVDFEYPARLRSPQSVEIYARVEGILLSKNFKEGDIVNKGDKLFKIDPTTYQNQVNIARAQYQSAQANLTRATRDWKRVEGLYKQGVVTIDSYDTSRYNYEAALATLANTKATLDDALVNLGYTDVNASITGRTSMRQYDVGNLVGRGNNNVLTTITQLTPIYAEFAIPSSDFYYIRDLSGENIEVELILGNGLPYEKVGKLDFIDSVLDSQTLSVKARAIFNNDEYKLLPNELVRVNIKGLEDKNAIAIPQTALMQDKEGSFVYVAKDGKAAQVRVIIGKALKTAETIIASGLKSGDVLITSNLSKIRPGVDVVKLQTDSASPAKADSGNKAGADKASDKTSAPNKPNDKAESNTSQSQTQSQEKSRASLDSSRASLDSGLHASLYADSSTPESSALESATTKPANPATNPANYQQEASHAQDATSAPSA